MSDRELLESAAKAAGIRLHVWGTEGSENFADMDSGRFGKLWNPLKDDGDALRLAVKINQLRAYVYGDEVSLAASEFGIIEKCNGDPCAATRRAIVRAAAEIGRKL